MGFMLYAVTASLYRGLLTLSVIWFFSKVLEPYKLAVFGYALTAMLALVFVPGIGLGGAALALSASAIFMGITAAFRLRSKHAARIPMDVLLLGGYCLVGVLLPAWIPVGIGEGSAGGLAVRASYMLAVLTGLWFLAGNDDRAFVTRAAGGLFRARLPSR